MQPKTSLWSCFCIHGSSVMAIFHRWCFHCLLSDKLTFKIWVGFLMLLLMQILVKIWMKFSNPKWILQQRHPVSNSYFRIGLHSHVLIFKWWVIFLMALLMPIFLKMKMKFSNPIEILRQRHLVSNSYFRIDLHSDVLIFKWWVIFLMALLLHIFLKMKMIFF